MNPPVIEARGLGMRFGRTWVMRNLELAVQAGEVVALVGGSGSGKTTLLRQLIGLLRPTRGEVRLFGQPLFSGDAEADRALRQRFGMVFQQGALFSAFSVFDNIAFPLRELKCLTEPMIRDIVMAKMEMVELVPGDAPLMPAEISGGMMKRVALARALALDPELLLLDEPTAGLDPDRSDAFVDLIRLLRSQLQLTVVLVTHDLDTLGAMATRVAVLAEQRILATGAVAEIVQVQHPFIESFFSCGRAQRALARVPR